jgi:hypothetical protein
MEPSGDIGSVKAALHTLLTGPDFERQLVEIEARFDDGITVPRLAAHQVKTAEHEGVPDDFPVCEIVGARSVLDNESEYADKHTHRLSIVIWANGDDEETVTKICERFMLATRKLLRSESLMPSIGCLPVVRDAEEYAPVGQKGGLAQPFVKAAAITFAVTTITA